MKPYCILLFPILLLAGCGAPHDEATPNAVVDVKTAKVETADVKIVVKAPAGIFACEQANISSRITAPIRKLLARKGDTVEAGQALAQLDNRDLAAQRDEAAAAVSEAEANLQKLMSGTIPADIERARGQMVSSEATLNQAQKIYDRRRQLFDQGAIPQRELLISQTDLAQATAAFEVAKKTLDLLQNQSRDKDILSAKSKLEQAQARLSSAKAQLEFSEIRSASEGTITEQYMFPGDMAKPDAPLFTIMNMSIAVARAQVQEIDASGVQRGKICAFIPTDSKGASFTGSVSMVNQAVDPGRRTVEVWCEIPNPKRNLKSGMYGQVQIVKSIEPRSFIVPLAAVQFIEGANKGTVMVAGEKGLAVKKDVETGEIYEGKVQIKKGLAATDAVIVQGAYGLNEGTQIRIQEEKKP
jgi:HlyD family secretion protein